jgi:hypothetical protein
MIGHTLMVYLKCSRSLGDNDPKDEEVVKRAAIRCAGYPCILDLH